MSRSLRTGLAFFAALPIFYFLFFYGLADAGLVGPDEPRYASIGRDMARSADWITPRLWGNPWFEKPALLYWMTAAGTLAGLGPETAPRLPVALLSTAFLILFFVLLRREFGLRSALYSTAILATSAGWVAFSGAGVTDLPLAATFSAGMLLLLRSYSTGAKGLLPAAGVMFGLAVLAKGLVPAVLAVPSLWLLRRRLSRLWIVLAAAAAVAAPWYVLVYLRNGQPFIDEFFLKHHFGRFADGALAHTQPFWFYLPVLLAGLFPWTPLLALLFRRALYRDPRLVFLLAWFAFGFVFFSLSANKLPGYLLPLIPAVAALAGVALAGSGRPSLALAASAALPALLPAVAIVLPQALESGLSRATVSPQAFWYGAPVLLLALLTLRFQPAVSMALIVSVVAMGLAVMKRTVLPQIDRRVSARSLWEEVSSRKGEICIGSEVHRAWRYGLNYYAGGALPDCPAAPGVLAIRQEPRERPRAEKTPEVR